MRFRFEWLFPAFITLQSSAVYAQDVVVGVNVVNPMRASVADQNAVFDQLQAAHVQVIRCSISNDDKGIDFATRAAAAGRRSARFESVDPGPWRYRTVTSNPATNPDDVVVQTWHSYPTRFLPEGRAGTLTSVVVQTVGSR